MYRLTTIKRRAYRLAAVSMAALILLSTAVHAGAAVPPVGTPVTFTYKVVNPGFVGLVTGQTMRLNFVLLDGSVRPVRAQVKVSYNGSAILIRNHELSTTAKVHSLDISRADLSVAGEPGTGRVQLWVEVELVLSADREKAVDPAAALLPSFELIDDESGQTILIGMLLPAIQKVRDKNGL